MDNVARTALRRLHDSIAGEFPDTDAYLFPPDEMVCVLHQRLTGLILFLTAHDSAGQDGEIWMQAGTAILVREVQDSDGDFGGLHSLVARALTGELMEHFRPTQHGRAEPIGYSIRGDGETLFAGGHTPTSEDFTVTVRGHFGAGVDRR